MEAQEEIWKDIPEYNGVYQVSNLGRVKSNGFDYVGNNNIRCVIFPRILKKIINPVSGYEQVYLRKNKKAKTHKVHRLVATAFCDNPYSKNVVNHINRIKHDNRAENLEWVTTAENVRHSFTNPDRIPNRKGHFNEFGCRKIKMINLKTKEVVCEYPSINEAQRQTGILTSSICAYIGGRYKHAGGYGWEYA